jgi:hypothetical protein
VQSRIFEEAGTGANSADASRAWSSVKRNIEPPRHAPPPPAAFTSTGGESGFGVMAGINDGMGSKDGQPPFEQPKARHTPGALLLCSSVTAVAVASPPGVQPRNGGLFLPCWRGGLRTADMCLEAKFRILRLMCSRTTAVCFQLVEAVCSLLAGRTEDWLTWVLAIRLREVLAKASTNWSTYNQKSCHLEPPQHAVVPRLK